MATLVGQLVVDISRAQCGCGIIRGMVVFYYILFTYLPENQP